MAVQKVSEIVAALRAHPSTSEEGVELVPFEENVSPKVARVDITDKAKTTVFSVTVSIRARFPAEADFWGRVSFVAARYDKLAAFAQIYAGAKGVDIFLEEARLEKQKDEPDRYRIYRK